MTNTACTVLFAAAIIAASASAAKAEQMKAEIPFAFHAASVTLPAGSYEVTRVSGSGSMIYRIANQSGGPKVLIVRNYRLERVARSDAGSRLVFNCAGDECSLTQVWVDGANGSGFNAVKSARSRESHQVAVALTSRRAD